MATQGFTVTTSPVDAVTAIPLDRGKTYQLQNRSPRNLFVWSADNELADPDVLLQSEDDAGQIYPAGSGEYETMLHARGHHDRIDLFVVA